MNHTAPTQSCQCAAAPKLIFPCSGAADVGEISDRAARLLTQEGKGRMYCLAAVGGRIPGILTQVRMAKTILAIDGCPTECAKNTLLQAGFTTFEHIQLRNLGLAKGSSVPSFDNIQLAVRKAEQLLQK